MKTMTHDKVRSIIKERNSTLKPVTQSLIHDSKYSVLIVVHVCLLGWKKTSPGVLLYYKTFPGVLLYVMVYLV